MIGITLMMLIALLAVICIDTVICVCLEVSIGV
jgi:hypothetical protein